KGRHAAARLPRLPQQERDGLDVHPLQDARAGESRFPCHVHAEAPAQRPRSRARCRAHSRCADAAHFDYARSPTADDRARHDGRGFLHAAAHAGEGVGHRAQARERAGQRRTELMYTATADVVLPTTIIGSLPRPGWYTQNLGRREFREAMVDRSYREQYLDAVSTYLRDQEVAGLDIVTDGDCRFDADVGGQTWTSYPPRHMSGFEASHPQLARAGAGGIGFPRGHILHDYLEARVMPKIVGPVGPGEMQYAEVWQAAQRLTSRPLKFGTVAPELVAYAVQDEHYKDLPSRIMALSDAFNKELHDLADAGCPVIQIEDPQLHLLAARPVG